MPSHFLPHTWWHRAWRIDNTLTNARFQIRWINALIHRPGFSLFHSLHICHDNFCKTCPIDTNPTVYCLSDCDLIAETLNMGGFCNFARRVASNSEVPDHGWARELIFSNVTQAGTLGFGRFQVRVACRDVIQVARSAVYRAFSQADS